MSAMDRQRHKADSVDKYELYFQILKEKIDRFKIQTRLMYNMDEKGFMIGVLGRSKRIFDKDAWRAKKVRSAIQDGNRTWVTVLAATCADGTRLSPSIIYEAAGPDVRDNWVAEMDPERHQCFFTTSPSGWTNNDIGLSWLEQVFDRETKAKARTRYRLLIVDGHGSHLTQKFLDYCLAHKILLAILPPHSTHTVQPLDVCCFKALSSAYDVALQNYMSRSLGISPVRKGDFFPVFWEAWEKSMSQELILSSYKATGLSPFNPDVVLDRFRHKTRERSNSLTSLRESSTSYYSGDEWPKINNTLRKITTDDNSGSAKKLARSLHHIGVANEVMRHEIDGLRQALLDSKKHTTQARTLPLQTQENYTGGAILWSPRKVREARRRREEADAAAHAEELRKANKRQLQESAKLLKETEAQERREKREKEKEERDAARAKQRAEIDARKQTRADARAIKLSQIGKTKVSKVRPVKKKPNTRRCRAAQVVEVEEVPIETPGITTRRGRAIQRPARYK